MINNFVAEKQRSLWPWKSNPPPTSLNICFVARKFAFGSRPTTESYLWPIAKGLVKKGHKVSILTYAPNQSMTDSTVEGVQIFFTREHELYEQEKAFKDTFARLHYENHFHIVHILDSCGLEIAKNRKQYVISVALDAGATQMSQLFAIAGMAQESLGSLMATSFAVAYKFLRTYFDKDRHLLKHADGVFVMTPFERKILERYYMYPDYHIYSVPYGFDISDLKDNWLDRSNEINLGSIKLPPEAQVILTVSDMTEIHSMICLLEAFERLAVKNSNVFLIILGNGPKYFEIEYELLSLALGNRVFMPGPLKNQDLSHFVQASDVFINLSSKSAGFDPAVIEAMAQEKIVIGSEVGVLSSLIEDGVDGFLVRPADVKTISRLLTEIFSGDFHHQEIKSQARQKVLKLFDTSKMVDETLISYFNILKKIGRY